MGFGNTLLRGARFQRGRSLLRLPKRFDKQPQILGHIGERQNANCILHATFKHLLVNISLIKHPVFTESDY
jgi:hypothetical protein